MTKKILVTLAALSLVTVSTGAFASSRDQNAALGGAIGAVAGLMIGQAQAGPNGAIPGALIGAVAGAAIGSAATPTRYYPGYGRHGYYQPVRYRPAPRVVYRPAPRYRYYPPVRHGRHHGWNRHHH
ncbi:MAG: glycine zipper 2TM domain-containing protein [Nevskiaceae bacterium]|nr:MAG: glycine zipper 2TM domain-containing protein [Nevskiaceae bacterium]TBR71373.1 MAG: glycine zipper 2TM domain-containing protein [Nevskiaceae bacterium]